MKPIFGITFTVFAGLRHSDCDPGRFIGPCASDPAKVAGLKLFILYFILLRRIKRFHSEKDS